MSDPDDETGFLARWSRRKVRSQHEPAIEHTARAEAAAAGVMAVPSPMVIAPQQPTTDSAQHPQEASATQIEARRPAPTLADVAALTHESDFSRFITAEVGGDVRNAALKKLFGNPHFNVMDGLDVYIDDYSKADPMPAAMARQLAQAAFVGLVDVEPRAGGAPAPAIGAVAPVAAPASAVREPCEANTESDENADLRLQSHDAAGCSGAEDSAAADRRSQL
jgi:hypothetical protein